MPTVLKNILTPTSGLQCNISGVFSSEITCSKKNTTQKITIYIYIAVKKLNPVTFIAGLSNI
jgi:hypothetical protein